MELTKRILCELIDIDSTFGNEAAIGRYLRGLFEHRGYRIIEQELPAPAGLSRTARRHNLIIERGEPRLFFFGHVDTVYPAAEPSARWSHSPFEAVEQEGRIYGLGAADMKSGVAAFVAAVLELAPEHVGICLTCDEEGKFAGVRTLVDSNHFAERQPELAVFAEPTNLDIINTHRGCIEISMRAHGKAAHAAMSHLGVDASQLYLCLDALRRELQRDFPDTNYNIGFFEAGHPDAINVVPDRADAVIDVRPSAELQSLGAALVVERLQALVAEADLDLKHEVTIDMKPLHTDPADLAILEQAVREAGIDFEYADLLGTSEAGQVKSCFGFPCVHFGPGPMAMAHRVDEYVDLEMLAGCRQVFERLIRAYG